MMMARRSDARTAAIARTKPPDDRPFSVEEDLFLLALRDRYQPRHVAS
jgi:hypothetical protein